MAPPASQPLLALLLQVASLLTERSDGDSPSCTRDVLTVPRAQPAMMSCAMSTPLSHVAIRLSAPGKASRLIFGVDGPGHFSNNGWRLEVRGGEARLVIPDAQPAQAGEYTWYLVGTHRSVGHTSLNVSVIPELLVTEAASTPPAAPGTHAPPPASTVSPVTVPLAVIVPILVLALIVLLWHRRRRNLQRIPQVSESAASRWPPQEEAGAAEAAIPMVGPSIQDTDSFRLESEAPGSDSSPRAVGLEELRWLDRPSQGLPGPPGSEHTAPRLTSPSGSSGEVPSTSASSWLSKGCDCSPPAGLSARGLLPGSQGLPCAAPWPLTVQSSGG